VRDADLIARTEALLDAEAMAGRFSGAALVAQGSEPLLAAARGCAIEPGVAANRTTTRFNIASVTKMLTAIGVLQLVARGALALDTPVATYNPDLPHAAEVTVHQLLTHTAGFDRYWNDAYRAARSDLRTVSDYLKLFAGEPLLFTPGSRHHYGNTGYVVLGGLIEAVTGTSYYDYMRRAVFEPAGMRDTEFLELDLPRADCATGYTLENWPGPADGQRRANTFMYAVKGSPSEHCYSTVHDLFRFFEALRGGRLLDEAHLAKAMMPYYAAGQGVSYGYGFHIVDDGGHGLAIGHGGRAMGGDAFAMWYRELGYTVIVLANYDRPAARRILNALGGWLIA
jgi:D-alanyl-D-alanine carboxypeptidase